MLLTPKDFAILLLFTENEGQVISSEYLYEKVWKASINQNTQAVKSAISRLRKKLDKSGYTISTMRNEGYIFERNQRS